MEFCIKKERTVIDRFAVTLGMFIHMLNEHKPSEIFNSQYSEKKPCWIITEYLENNRVKYYADGWADKTPVEESMENLYTSWRLQGLEYCYTKQTP